MNINMDASAMETSQRHRSVLENKLGYTVDKYGTGQYEKVEGAIEGHRKLKSTINKKIKSTIDNRGPQKIKFIILN
jgi:hypothetical protein